jgi:hypothetical protein
VLEQRGLELRPHRLRITFEQIALAHHLGQLLDLPRLVALDVAQGLYRGVAPDVARRDMARHVRRGQRGPAAPRSLALPFSFSRTLARAVAPRRGLARRRGSIAARPFPAPPFAVLAALIPHALVPIPTRADLGQHRSILVVGLRVAVLRVRGIERRGLELVSIDLGRVLVGGRGHLAGPNRALRRRQQVLQVSLSFRDDQHGITGLHDVLAGDLDDLGDLAGNHRHALDRDRGGTRELPHVVLDLVDEAVLALLELGGEPGLHAAQRHLAGFGQQLPLQRQPAQLFDVERSAGVLEDRHRGFDEIHWREPYLPRPAQSTRRASLGHKLASPRSRV